MIRKITRNKQVTIPKVFLDRLDLAEGDYVAIECVQDTIELRPARMDAFDGRDYERLAAKLDELKNEPGTRHDSTDSARRHLKKMMR